MRSSLSSLTQHWSTKKPTGAGPWALKAVKSEGDAQLRCFTFGVLTMVSAPGPPLTVASTSAVPPELSTTLKVKMSLPGPPRTRPRSSPVLPALSVRLALMVSSPGPPLAFKRSLPLRTPC